MARRFQEITEIYRQEIAALARADRWTAFLRSACRNYKLPFEEQVLVHAQRPDATAVLEIERWNRQFGRWVNKGATGIAVRCLICLRSTNRRIHRSHHCSPIPSCRSRSWMKPCA